jgi:hypothetical protein
MRQNEAGRWTFWYEALGKSFALGKSVSMVSNLTPCCAASRVRLDRRAP